MAVYLRSGQCTAVTQTVCFGRTHRAGCACCASSTRATRCRRCPWGPSSAAAGGAPTHAVSYLLHGGAPCRSLR